MRLLFVKQLGVCFMRRAFFIIVVSTFEKRAQFPPYRQCFCPLTYVVYVFLGDVVGGTVVLHDELRQLF
jgi:hypothetical protein